MGNEEKKTEKATPGERILKKWDIEPDILTGGHQIELRGRYRVKLCGADKILCYSDSVIRLRLGREEVAVEGARLECMSFTRGTAVIVGRIDRVSFGKEEKA